MKNQSLNNLAAIQEAGSFSCFSCLTTLPATSVVETCDNNQTAICPSCGIDACLPSPITAAELAALNETQFGA